MKTAFWLILVLVIVAGNILWLINRPVQLVYYCPQTSLDKDIKLPPPGYDPAHPVIYNHDVKG